MRQQGFIMIRLLQHRFVEMQRALSRTVCSREPSCLSQRHSCYFLWWLTQKKTWGCNYLQIARHWVLYGSFTLAVLTLFWLAKEDVWKFLKKLKMTCFLLFFSLYHCVITLEDWLRPSLTDLLWRCSRGLNISSVKGHL